MNKLIVLALLALSVVAEAGGRRAPLPTPSPSPTPASTPVTGPHPRLMLTGVIRATAQEMKRLQDAVTLGNRILAESCFRDIVINSHWSGTKIPGPQIYEIMSKEPMGFTVEIFDGTWWENHMTKTIAYEGTGAQIRLNRYFLGTPRSIAATYAHERGGHALGFSHPYGAGTGQPYGVGDAIMDCP